ncbi:MAG: class II fumarate hydratase [Oleibacter sp.]|nr:class II fumarate hydratase [Thalassolituus sp.]
MSEKNTSSTAYRIEHDSMGDVNVPEHALYGAQTQRAIDNFTIANRPMSKPFVVALLQLKRAAAIANAELDNIHTDIAKAIVSSVDQLLADPDMMVSFPIDIMQTGSGTSTNMNANEVLASLSARALNQSISPNDHVNASQSSNDVIPSAMHIAAFLHWQNELQPALEHMLAVLEDKKNQLGPVVKTGRTHLMDAMPVRFDQVLDGWAALIRDAQAHLEHAAEYLQQLVIGGTAVGTGINSSEAFAGKVCEQLNNALNTSFGVADNRFAGMGSQNTIVVTSGALKNLAVALMKIANDLRWMNSGPLAGLGEIELPALQPGSSIMPGKVNPVIPEAVAMAAAQVMGNDTTVTVAGQSGNFELNVMLPILIENTLSSMGLMSRSLTSLADQAIAGFTLRERHIAEPLAKNPILVTALNSRVGYEHAAKIAKAAYQSGRPVIDVAEEMTDINRAELETLLNPKDLTESL